MWIYEINSIDNIKLNSLIITYLNNIIKKNVEYMIISRINNQTNNLSI